MGKEQAGAPIANGESGLWRRPPAYRPGGRSRRHRVANRSQQAPRFGGADPAWVGSFCISVRGRLPIRYRHFRARSLSLYVGNFFDRGRSRNRIQAEIMLGSSYMARPTWLYLPGAILVLNDR